MPKYLFMSLILCAVLALTGAGCFLLPSEQGSITNFEECAAAGNPIMESYPRQCRAGDQTFVEQVETTPSDGQVIGGQKDEHGCLTPAGYSWCEPKQTCMRFWEGDGCYASAEEGIKYAFADKYGKPLDEIHLTFQKETATHVRGSVVISKTGEGEGGNFLAYESNGFWILAFDGNGGYSCASVAEFNFPQDMISDCAAE